MRKITLIVLILLMLLPGALASAEEAIQESDSCMGIIRNNRLFIPLRSVFTNLGYSVNWDGHAAIIENNKTRLTLAVGKNRAEVNSTEKAITDPPILINGRVYIPLRIASESLEADVSWDDRKRTAVISYNGKEVSVYARDEKTITHYSRMYSINGRKISVNAVEIPFHAAMPDMVVAGDAVGNREELARMAERSGAIVAVNGTFFSAYSDPPLPYGNIIKNGKIIHRGSVGTTCGFYADGTVNHPMPKGRGLQG